MSRSRVVARYPGLTALVLAVVLTGASAAAAPRSGSAKPRLPARAEAAAAPVACPAAGGTATPDAPAPTQGDVIFYGHGWGHGLGMSQYGAQGAARLGCSYAQILTTYYHGVSLVSRALTAPVKLKLLTRSSRSTVFAETGSVTWVVPGASTVVQPRGATWRVVRQGENAGPTGGLAVLDETGRRRAWVGDGADLSVRHSGTVIRLRSYRGTATSSSSDLRLIWDEAHLRGSSTGTTVT